MITVMLFWLMAFQSFAQTQTQSTIYWYFGNSGNGFRFIRPDYTAEALSIPTNLGNGMSGVATDPVSGVVLFYTDGVNVYDREHNIMPNGTGLNGSAIFNQGVAICVNPDNPDQYFIFTNNGTILQTTVDMSLNAPNANAIPLGQVLTKNLPVNGLAGTYDPGMIILPKDSRDGFWLIAHQSGSTSYNAVDISATGTAALAPTFINNAPTVVENFSYNPASGLLAIAPRNAAEQAATVTFNTGSGLFNTTATPIPGTAGSTQAYNIFDMEWSNDGRFLYLSGNFNGANDVLMQVDRTESPLTLRPVPTQNIQRSYGLQMAPDSTIYHLYRHTNGQFRVGRINDPDTIAAQTRYAANAFGNGINYQGRQFPAFLPPFDPMINATIETSGTCANVPTLFFPTIEPGADSVRWDFGDGGGSTDLAPFYTYTQGGNYTVSLRVYLNGDSASFTTGVNITQFDLQISGFPESDTVCAEDFPVEYTAEAQSAGGGQGPQATFRWSNQLIDGATTTIDSAGNYYVTATDPSTGCVAYQPLRVVEYRAIQQRAFVWYFGEHGGIDFNPIVDVNNPGPARPIPFGDPNDFFGGSRMTAPEGCAIFCDDNGQPLFYSDGVDIFDRLGTQIATDIGGSKNATQSVFIVEFPNDATLFYLFLAREVYDPNGNMSYELNYVVFDLKQRDGLGDLLRDAADNVIITKLFSPNTERITGNNNWVIAHEWGNSNFRAYPVNGEGVGAAVVSNVGAVHNSSTSNTAQGYMKLAPTGKLAVGVSQSNTENYIEIFDFDNGTGAITNPLRLDFGNETGQVYGVEFSSDYRKIFATIRTPGGPSKIYRWQIDTTTVAGNETDPSFITASRNLVATETEDLGALQLGPDGQIYVARDGSVNLGTITNPNADMTTTPIQDAGFLLDGFGLGENLVDGGFTRSLLGLPNFSSQYATSPQEISAEVFSGCIGETLTFNVINTQSLESYRWNVYDSDSVLVASGNGESFDFSTMTAGRYSVRVDVIPDCQIVENPPLPAFATFDIFGEPVVDITNIIDPSACGNTDGQFTVTIPETTGSYAFELSGPVSFVSDTLAGPVNQVVPNLPAGTYNVYVINTISGCQSAASAVLTDTGVRFQLDATPMDASCDLDDGSIDITITPDAGYTVGYPVNYVLRFEGSNDGLITGTYDNADGLQTISISQQLLAGVYNIEVTELNGDGCTNTLENIVIGSPPEATLQTPLEVVACDINEAQIPFVTDAPGIRVVEPAPGNYEIINGELTVFAQGDWTIETVDQSGALCPATATVPVTFAQSDPLPPNIERTYSICPDDPEEENRSAIIDPGNPNLPVTYYDPQGVEIVGSGPDYSLDGNVLTVFQEGPIEIEITNAFGCVTRETINVVIDCRARITVPDAFRPNSPIAENQVWKVYPFLVSEDDFQIFIFNRWGEMIAQSNDLNFEWNGGYDNNEGRPVPGGTYAYRILYRSIYEDGRGIQEERGAILLIR